ncbi:hypothetical protein [Acinetobacter baumannii]|uniref:hypothetical protein n=1 Tax=Acinetobacter baumannii TaxID=470 RepID=UPI00233FF021|nr:hypothetical protein [Acinetobacter baumannii]MDC4147551.1 hypothetical protein [Acinetobacter baumannii]
MKFVLLPFIVIFIIIADGVAKHFMQPLNAFVYLAIAAFITIVLFFWSGKEKAIQSLLLFSLLAFYIY